MDIGVSLPDAVGYGCVLYTAQCGHLVQVRCRCPHPRGHAPHSRCAGPLVVSIVLVTSPTHGMPLKLRGHMGAAWVSISCHGSRPHSQKQHSAPRPSPLPPHPCSLTPAPSPLPPHPSPPPTTPALQPPRPPLHNPVTLALRPLSSCPTLALLHPLSAGACKRGELCKLYCSLLSMYAVA